MTFTQSLRYTNVIQGQYRDIVLTIYAKPETKNSSLLKLEVDSALDIKIPTNVFKLIPGGTANIYGTMLVPQNYPSTGTIVPKLYQNFGGSWSKTINDLQTITVHTDPIWTYGPDLNILVNPDPTVVWSIENPLITTSGWAKESWGTDLWGSPDMEVSSLVWYGQNAKPITFVIQTGSHKVITLEAAPIVSFSPSVDYTDGWGIDDFAYGEWYTGDAVSGWSDGAYSDDEWYINTDVTGWSDGGYSDDEWYVAEVGWGSELYSSDPWYTGETNIGWGTEDYAYDEWYTGEDVVVTTTVLGWGTERFSYDKWNGEEIADSSAIGEIFINFPPVLLSDSFMVSDDNNKVRAYGSQAPVLRQSPLSGFPNPVRDFVTIVSPMYIYKTGFSSQKTKNSFKISYAKRNLVSAGYSASVLLSIGQIKSYQFRRLANTNTIISVSSPSVVVKCYDALGYPLGLATHISPFTYVSDSTTDEVCILLYNMDMTATTATINIT